MSASWSAKLFAELAQALTPHGYNLPEWMALPGQEWPLFDVAVKVAAKQPTAQWARAIEALTRVEAASLETRGSEYNALFLGNGHPAIWLYESNHLNGHVPGPATFSVKSIYERAGLEVEGAELPDHAAMELSFLAFLCQQEAQSSDSEWRAVRRLFIKKHAGKWLPEVGRALIRNEYPTWQTVGHLLIAVFTPISLRIPDSLNLLLPELSDSTTCNLCGFCVQICPTKALQMYEDEHQTELRLLSNRCVSCHKCERTCTPGALTLVGAAVTGLQVLRRSARACCPHCGTPTVSQAELESIAAKLGDHPTWIDACLGCR